MTETEVFGLVSGFITGIMLIVGWIVFYAPKHITRNRDPEKIKNDKDEW